jgi:hypothetical protein
VRGLQLFPEAFRPQIPGASRRVCVEPLIDQRGRADDSQEVVGAQRRRSAKASDRSRNMIEVLSSPLAGGDEAVVSVTASLSDGTSTAGRGSLMTNFGLPDEPGFAVRDVNLDRAALSVTNRGKSVLTQRESQSVEAGVHRLGGDRFTTADQQPC